MKLIHLWVIPLRQPCELVIRDQLHEYYTLYREVDI